MDNSKTVINLAIVLSFLPIVLIALFADPTQGAFTKSFGTFATLFISGCLASFVMKKYAEQNGLGASAAWAIILAIGMGIATCF